MAEISKFISPQGRAAYERAVAEQRTKPPQELIDSIERTDYQAMPGPLVNRLEWHEIKRRHLAS